MTTFGLTTLGCKVNFYESEWIRQQLEAGGRVYLESAGPCPDDAIVNTCTVTGRADRQSRQAIYRIARQCPETRIHVTGCYAHRSPELLSGLPNVVSVVSNENKLSLPGLINGTSPVFPPPAFEKMALTRYESHTRAYLMIQNGCEAGCAYCIIPETRGKNRSKPPDVVLSELDILAATRHREIVLCGIHLGKYGHDLIPPTDLLRLLDAIENHPFRGLIRLSSIEPMELSGEIIRRVADSEKVCPHFHIPLQSGHTDTLKKMRRPYTAERYETLIHTIRQCIPHCTIGCDVMVGFPGETDQDFMMTARFLEALPVSYLHVFPYSERPGTAAVLLTPKVPEQVKKERAGILNTLAVEKRRTFYESWKGKRCEVLFENRDGKTGFWKGKSRHYLPVHVASPESLTGERREVEILETNGENALGVLR
jgi:threonylcarbamoyladenosine tRNA methylthiotransferase MtaB